MAIETVRAYFETLHIAHRIQEFSVSSATVELAAEALHCEAKRIAKTLSFELGEGCVLIVAAGDAKVDNAKFKAQFRTKAKMLAPAQVEMLVGHAVGGVCPFAVQDTASVYLDASLKRFSTVFPACGSANSAVELTLAELEQYSRSAGWVDVCKGWQENAQEGTASA